jgi:tetratricopeptide (TPR) repeat protein
MKLSDINIKDLINHQKGSLEHALLVISGLNRVGIIEYNLKINGLHNVFKDHLKQKTDVRLSGFEKAYMIHEFLWSNNSERYNSNVTLDKVVDAELAGEQVGNCLGLTSLYAVMLERENIRSEIVVTNNHVLSRLRSRKRTVNIETTSKSGYASVHHLDKSSVPSYCLVAAVLNDLAKDLEESKNRKQAIEYNTIALMIWPEFVNALAARAMLYSNRDEMSLAEKDYTALITVEPNEAVSHYNRGVIRMNMGKYRTALPDFRTAAILVPECSKYHSTKAEAEFKCNNYKQAAQDATKAIRLDKKNKDAYWVRSMARQHLGDTKGKLADHSKYVALSN